MCRLRSPTLRAPSEEIAKPIEDEPERETAAKPLENRLRSWNYLSNLEASILRLSLLPACSAFFSLILFPPPPPLQLTLLKEPPSFSAICKQAPVLFWGGRRRVASLLDGYLLGCIAGCCSNALMRLGSARSLLLSPPCFFLCRCLWQSSHPSLFF